MIASMLLMIAAIPLTAEHLLHNQTHSESIDAIGFDKNPCGNLTFEYFKTWKEYEFWCEGVLFSCLGVFGLLSNLVTIITILSSPSMKQHTFNQLLVALSFFVILYIIFNVPVRARTIPEVSSWFSGSSFLSQLYAIVLYPMSAVSFCATIYMTLALTTERYLAVCRPHKYRALSRSISSTKRFLAYVIPVTVTSFALNIPKFLEVEIKDSNGTNLVLPSRTRQDLTYIFWYTVSMIWHPTITTAIIPFVALSYMNFHIFKGLKQSAKTMRSTGQNNCQRIISESNLALTLVSIIFMHMICNCLRVFLGVLVVTLVDVQIRCIKEHLQYIPPLYVMCLESVAHLLVMVNFALNFLIYVTVSQEFKSTFYKLLCCNLRKTFLVEV